MNPQVHYRTRMTLLAVMIVALYTAARIETSSAWTLTTTTKRIKTPLGSQQGMVLPNSPRIIRLPPLKAQEEESMNDAGSATTALDDPVINGINGFHVEDDNDELEEDDGELNNVQVESSLDRQSKNDYNNDYELEQKRRMAAAFKEKIRALAFRTQCGFKATSTDRQRMRYLMQQLAAYNPTAEPAADFYENNNAKSNRNNSDQPPSITGKWTLLYTDAPDILSLAENETWARLQRIGQECRQGSDDDQPATIRNVIEWFPPVWAGALPPALGVGSADNNGQPRILQKVITQGSASPEQPFRVNLLLQGIEIETDVDDGKDEMNNNNNNNLWNKIQRRGWLTALLRQRPIRLQGPVTAPFGSFDILYLDDELRVVRTSQGYYAINQRNNADNAWF